MPAHSCPRIVVNLDLPPKDRWNAVIQHFRQDILGVHHLLKQELKEEGSWFGNKILDGIIAPAANVAAKAGLVLYGKEIRGLAEQLGISAGEAILMQFAYEAAANCTSVVVPDPTSGMAHHIRTMDWPMDYLKSLTFEADFQSGGQTVFLATTWPGYVGVLTGMRPGAFSVSVNYRTTGTGYWSNVKKTLGSAWPIGYLVRSTLADAGDFEEAVNWLTFSQVVAPVYFTVAGTAPDQGRILSRDRNPPKDEHDTKAVRRMDSDNLGPLVQTNKDHWEYDEDRDEGIMYSRRRYRKAQKVISAAMQSPGLGDPITTLFDCMSVDPVMNDITVYGTYMCPTTGTFETRIPDDAGFANVQPYTGGDRTKCTACGFAYLPELNAPKQCAHAGDWHAAVSDCSKLKCAVGLGTDIGRQHWSCCFETVQGNTLCRKSGVHQ